MMPDRDGGKDQVQKLREVLPGDASLEDILYSIDEEVWTQGNDDVSGEVSTGDDSRNNPRGSKPRGGPRGQKLTAQRFRKLEQAEPQLAPKPSQ